MNPPAAPALSRCPRCDGDFNCGAAAPGPCACTGITLSAALQVQLRAQYAGCLCMRCLLALAGADAGGSHTASRP